MIFVTLYKAICGHKSFEKQKSPSVDIFDTKMDLNPPHVKFPSSFLYKSHRTPVSDLTRPLSSRQRKKQKNSPKYPKAVCANCAGCHIFTDETRYPFAVRSEATNGEGIPRRNLPTELCCVCFVVLHWRHAVQSELIALSVVVGYICFNCLS